MAISHTRWADVRWTSTEKYAPVAQTPRSRRPPRGRVKTIGTPIHLEASQPQAPVAPPAIGEHSEDVLRRMLDLSQQEIDELRSAGVI